MELNNNSKVFENSSINEIRFNLEKERFNKQINIFMFFALTGGGLFIAWSVPKILLAIFFRISPPVAGILQFIAGIILLSAGILILYNKADFVENVKFDKDNLLFQKIKRINLLFVSLNSLIILQILWFIVNGIKFVCFINIFE